MKYLLQIGLLSLTFNLFGQQADSTEAKGIMTAAEKSAEFPGGREEFFRFVRSKIKYPKDARKKGKQGMVVISFVVERDGRIEPESIQVEQSIYPSLDEEAIRVVKLMPNWIPANQKGRNVRAKTFVPITFTLQ